MSLLGAVRPPNACRYAGIPGHVESYYWRANDPTAPRAFWLKATILAPLDGPAVAESWLVWFDGVHNRTFAAKQIWPLSSSKFSAKGDGEIQVGDWRLALGNPGSAEGSITSPQGKARMKLTWTRDPTPRGAPLSLYPWRFLESAPLPRMKFTTPWPSLRFEGELEVGDERVSVAGWTGMQGHQWGKAYSTYFDYGWGVCLFPAVGAEPEAMVEAGTGRVAVAGRPSPQFSVLAVRRGSREYRFAVLLNQRRQEAHLGTDQMTLRMSGPAGEVRLRLDARGRPMVCLGYTNPDGRLSYYFNSKVADTLLEVHPRGEAPFTCRSPSGGALEFMRRQPDPRFEVV